MNCDDEISVRRYFKERSKLNDLMVHEEEYWRQRAKMFWLEEGNTNSKFFHASTSTRKKINHISYLKIEDGDMVTTEQGMPAVIKDYFLNIFASSNSDTEDDQDTEASVITGERNRMLIADVTFSEFTLDVHQMHPDKASGPDGLNPVFFQHFWDLVGNDVFKWCYFV